MTPGVYALTLYRGDTYRWQFTLWSDANKTMAVDLTGVTAKSEIRDKSGGTKIVAMTCSITMPNIVNVTLTAEMCKLVPTSGVWDLQLTYLNGDVATCLAGSVSVTEDVTDSTAAAAMQVMRSTRTISTAAGRRA